MYVMNSPLSNFAAIHPMHHVPGTKVSGILDLTDLPVLHALILNFQHIHACQWETMIHWTLLTCGIETINKVLTNNCSGSPYSWCSHGRALQHGHSASRQCIHRHTAPILTLTHTLHPYQCICTDTLRPDKCIIQAVCIHFPP